MSITSHPSHKSPNEIVIDVAGRFDFSQQKAFRDAYKDHDTSSSFRVNLARTEYMDSSALGMLLLLRKHAGDQPGKVTLVGAKDAVAKILEIANFNKLFRIE